MKLIIDVNGNVGFDDWFDETDSEKIIEGLKSQGINVTVEKVDYEFKDYPILKKKERFESIPMTAQNIFTIMSNPDVDNDVVLEMMGIERESGFVITTLFKKLQGEYIKWQRIDHPIEWANDEERLRAFAGFFESSVKISDKGISREIKKMETKGCLRNKTERFPECKTEFNSECLSCQFGKEHIKTEADIKRFNYVWKRGTN